MGDVPPTMRPRIRNMRESDRRILEFLYNGDRNKIIANPAVIAENIDYANGTVRERMRPLRRAELIKYHDEDRAMYKIGDLGQRYMENELDDDEISNIEDSLNGSDG